MKTTVCSLLLAVAVSGCAGGSHLVPSGGRWEPVPDLVDGKVYSCCWYPHGYYRWVPAAARPRTAVPPARRQTPFEDR
jgi:hypothetical protein